MFKEKDYLHVAVFAPSGPYCHGNWAQNAQKTLKNYISKLNFRNRQFVVTYRTNSARRFPFWLHPPQAPPRARST